MSNTVEIRLKADGSGVVRTFKLTGDAVEDLNQELGKTPGQAGKAERSFADLNRQAGKLAQTAGSVGRAMSVGLTLPIGAAAAASAKLAIDAQETANKFDVVFGPAAERARARLVDLTDIIPLTVAEMEDLSSGTQDMLVPMGLARDLAADLSVNMVSLSGDMASFNNTTPDVMLNAFQSALAGSSEPLRAYGVDVREARLQTVALEEGLIEQGEAMSAAARAQAVFIAITRDSADAQGDAARTAADAANQIKLLQRDVRQLAEDMGVFLIPMVKELAESGRAGIAVLNELDEETKAWAIGIGAVAAASGPMLVGLSITINSLKTVAPLLKRVASAKGLLVTSIAGVTYAIVEGSRRFSRYDENVAQFARTLDTKATPAIERFSDAHIRMLNEMHELPTSVEALEAELAVAETQLRRLSRQYGENSVAARSAADRVQQLKIELAEMGVVSEEVEEASKKVGSVLDGILLAALNANRLAVQAAQEAYAELQREGADFMEGIESLAAELDGPVAVAFRNYTQQLEIANRLKKQGAISAGDLARAEAVLGQQLQAEVLPAMDRVIQKMINIAQFKFGGNGNGADDMAASFEDAAYAGLSRGIERAFNSMSAQDIMSMSVGEVGNLVGQSVLTSVGQSIGEDLGEKLGDKLGDVLEDTFGEAFGEALGKAIPVVGGIIGSLVGEWLGDLFGLNKDPRIGVGGASGFTRDINEARRRGNSIETAFGETFFRFRKIEGAAQQQIMAAFESLDATMATLIRDEGQMDEARRALDAMYQRLEGDDISAVELLETRFQVILGTFDGFVQGFVNQAAGLEAQIQRLADVQVIRSRMALGDLGGGDATIQLAADLARAGETVAQSFERLLQATTAVDEALALTNNSMEGGRAEIIRFSDALVAAFGDNLQRLTSGLNQIFETFFSDEERFEQQAETARQQAGELFAQLGVDISDALFTQGGFRNLFDSLFGTLSAEDTALLIEAGVAVADLIDAEAELAELRVDEVEQVQNMAAVLSERRSLENQLMELQGDIAGLREMELAALDPSNRALQERIWLLEDEQDAADAARAERERAQTLRETMRDIDREILRFVNPAMAAIRDLQDTQADQIRTLMDLGASEDELRRARYLHRLEMNQHISDLKISILTLADDLFGVEETFNDIGQSIVTSTSNARDAVIRNLEQIDQWLDRLNLSNISPLTPLERRQEAEGSFRAAFADIQRGNLQQLGDMPALADAALSELASFYGTSNPVYRELFEEIRGMMQSISGIDPPDEMRPPTFAQVDEIKGDASLFRQKLDDLERMQKAWNLGSEIGALATATGQLPADLVRDLGFTDQNMRDLLGLLGADVGTKTGEELEQYFTDVVSEIGAQNPLLLGMTGMSSHIADVIEWSTTHLQRTMFWQGNLLQQIIQALDAEVQDFDPWRPGEEPPPRPQLPGYAKGGWVPRTEPALVHAGEYVVPRNGALVGGDPEVRRTLQSIDSRLRSLENTTRSGLGAVVAEERRTGAAVKAKTATARA